PSASGYGAPQGPPVVPPGWGSPVGQGLPPGYAPGWAAPGQPGAQGGEAELATVLRVLFPVQSWLHNSGWRQGLRLAVIAYALLPLIFLTVLSSSSDLSTPGWAYSLYVAPLWATGFWMLIRPPEHLKKQEILIAAGIVVWTLIWIRLITVTVNDALPTKNGIGIVSAIVIGINEEVTKALPALVAGLLLLGIGTPALLHALNDWLAGTSPWLVILVQAASLLLFLGYTMSAAAIEQQVRETPIFRGQSMIMDAIKFGQPPPSA